jgi:hypothetical protein
MYLDNLAFVMGKFKYLRTVRISARTPRTPEQGEHWKKLTTFFIFFSAS